MKKPPCKIIKRISEYIFVAALIVAFIPVSGLAQEQKGKKLYDDWCASCHGYEGEGKGYAQEFTYPKPRDFASGTYKFRSTLPGEPPTDEDIKRIIIEGNPGTSMPAWKQFSEDELNALVDYIKGFDAEDFELPGDPIEIPKPPEVNNEIVEKGKKLFEKAKCWECHGGFARGSGKKARQEQKDDWGERIFPADLTHPWELRDGSRVEDLYRSITTGLSGTPMASYKDAYSDDERWALAYYLKSIQFKRKLGSALTAEKVENIPSSTEDELWDTVDYIDLPLSGQLMFEIRHFTPTLSNVRVRGLYTDSEVAIMLEWTDKNPNKGGDGFPPDAVRLQFPMKILAGAEKPYFYMGDKKNPVILWYWDAAEDHAAEFIAKGHEEKLISIKEQTDVKAVASYSDGLYRVLFTRQIDLKKEDDIAFALGKFIPFSVSVFDGLDWEQKEKNMASISVWYYLMLRPPTPLTVYVLPPFVSFAVLGLGITLHRKLNKKRQT